MQLAPQYTLLARPTPPAWGVAPAGWSWWQRVRGEPSAVAFTLGDVPSECVRTTKMARVEAVLLVAEGSLTLRKLIQLASLSDTREALGLIDRLNRAFQLAGSPFRVEGVANGYRLMTQPAFSFWLGKLHQREAELKLTPPALETLALIAYRQPVTRADVESIRGVQSIEMIKHLMERGLVRIGGEDTSLGRPFLYETTRKFLEVFGLRSLGDLPMADQLAVRRGTLSEEDDADKATESAA